MRSPASTVMSRFPSLSQSAGMPSPAPSLSSVFVPRSSLFAGQSPALSYRSITVPHALSGPPWSADIQATTMIEHRYQEAEEGRLRQELSLHEIQWGNEHPGILDVLADLGTILLNQGRYRSAEETFRKLAADCRAQFGDNNGRTVNALRWLGEVFRRQGLYDKAEKLLYKAEKLARGCSGQSIQIRYPA